MAAGAWSSKTEPLSRGIPYSSCLEPFTSDSPCSTKQFSLHVSEHLAHTEHNCNLISKNTIIAQCCRANKRVLLITFSPKAAVFPLLPTPLAGQGQLLFQWGKHHLHKHYRLGFVARVCVQGLKTRLKISWRGSLAILTSAWVVKLQVNDCPKTPSSPLPAVASCLHCTEAQQGPSLSAFGFPVLSQIIGPHKSHPAGMEKKEWLHSYTGGHPPLLEEASTARDQRQVQHFLHSQWAVGLRGLQMEPHAPPRTAGGTAALQRITSSTSLSKERSAVEPIT